MQYEISVISMITFKKCFVHVILNFNTFIGECCDRCRMTPFPLHGWHRLQNFSLNRDYPGKAQYVSIQACCQIVHAKHRWNLTIGHCLYCSQEVQFKAGKLSYIHKYNVYRLKQVFDRQYCGDIE